MSLIAAVLPVASFVLLLLLTRTRTGWREAFVVAAAVWGAWLTLVTEGLNAANAITRPTAFAAWLAVTAVLVFLVARRRTVLLRAAAVRPARLDGLILFCFVGTIVILMLVATSATFAPPNNWDSMTYHMARVVHWVDQQSLAHYPTHIPRQLYQGPWAEFAILHFLLLSGTDALSSFVQLFALAGSAIAATLLVRDLGGNSRSQAIAMLVTGTLPMAVLQGSSTQNDLVVAFWAVSFAFFAVRIQRQVPIVGPLADFALAGASLGLGVLTKATGYVILFPTAIWLVVVMLRQPSRLRVHGLIVLGILAFMLNAGHYHRNLGLFGSPLGGGELDYTNASITPLPVLTNVVRNVTMHLATPSDALNGTLTNVVTNGFRAVTGHVLDDPRTSWIETRFSIGGLRHEDIAANPMHVVACMIVAVLLLARRKRYSRGVLTYALVAAATALMFCVVLRWQPWHSRLQLPVFVLWAPLIALACEPVIRIKLVLPALSLLLWYAGAVACFNTTRGLVGPYNVFVVPRFSQYFANQRGLQQDYEGAAAFIRRSGCQRVGLYFTNDSWEYPLWLLLKHPFSLQHVMVENASSALGPAVPDVCAILRIEQSSPQWDLALGRATSTWNSGLVTVAILPRPAPMLGAGRSR